MYEAPLEGLPEDLAEVKFLVTFVIVKCMCDQQRLRASPARLLNPQHAGVVSVLQAQIAISLAIGTLWRGVYCLTCASFYLQSICRFLGMLKPEQPST